MSTYPCTYVHVQENRNWCRPSDTCHIHIVYDACCKDQFLTILLMYIYIYTYVCHTACTSHTMYICIYACIHVHICTYMYTVYVHICTYMLHVVCDVYVYVSKTSKSALESMYVLDTYMHICICRIRCLALNCSGLLLQQCSTYFADEMHIHVYMHTYTYIDMYTLIYVHVYTCTSVDYYTTSNTSYACTIYTLHHDVNATYICTHNSI